MVRRLFFALALMAGPLSAQTPAHTVVTDSVRAFLAREWDIYSVNPYQDERAYCVGYKSFGHKVTGTYLFVVTAIRPAEVTKASQRFVYYKPCEKDETAIHVHTNTTCTAGGCVIGGIEAWNCEESDTDRATLFKTGAPFAGTQCSREAISFHYHPYLKPQKP